jgi:hypothetical protein
MNDPLEELYEAYLENRKLWQERDDWLVILLGQAIDLITASKLDEAEDLLKQIIVGIEIKSKNRQKQ